MRLSFLRVRQPRPRVGPPPRASQRPATPQPSIRLPPRRAAPFENTRLDARGRGLPQKFRYFAGVRGGSVYERRKPNTSGPGRAGKRGRSTASLSYSSPSRPRVCTDGYSLTGDPSGHALRPGLSRGGGCACSPSLSSVASAAASSRTMTKRSHDRAASEDTRVQDATAHHADGHRVESNSVRDHRQRARQPGHAMGHGGKRM